MPDKTSITVNFNKLSKDAQLTAVGMIEYCIEHGIGMGMDEGWTRDNQKRAFRKQLEDFVAMPR